MLTETERGLGCWIASGDELVPNDVLVFLGKTYRIDALPPGESSIITDEGLRVIVTEGREFTWALPSQQYRILPRP
jgi:hypothetical protein